MKTDRIWNLANSLKKIIADDSTTREGSLCMELLVHPWGCYYASFRNNTPKDELKKGGHSRSLYPGHVYSTQSGCATLKVKTITSLIGWKR